MVGIVYTNVKTFTGDNCFRGGLQPVTEVMGANKIKIIEQSKQIGACFINELT
ncbi:MAG: hypothetical protein ABJA71_01230 [Ginsengibacter sp.]